MFSVLADMMLCGREFHVLADLMEKKFFLMADLNLVGKILRMWVLVLECSADLAQSFTKSSAL